MQKCFRRYAAAIKAYAARICFGIDKSDLHPEVCSEESSGITARAATDHGDVDFFIFLSFVGCLVESFVHEVAF